MRIGITGVSGFIGTHLAEYVIKTGLGEVVPFEDAYFSDEAELCGFVRSCDAIVHLAAASRMPSEQALYDLNVGLVEKLIAALDKENVRPLVMFASSTHETRDTAYGKAKKEGRRLLEAWAKRTGANFVGFIFPNIYGPGARVHYASFIANFAWDLQHGELPKVLVDAPVRLKYIDRLCEFIVRHLGNHGVSCVEVPWDLELRVTDVLALFRLFGMLAPEKIEDVLEFDNNLKNLYETYKGYAG